MHSTQFVHIFKSITKKLLLQCQNAFLVIDTSPTATVDPKANSVSESKLREIVELELPGLWENHPVFKFAIDTEVWDKQLDLIVGFRVKDLRTNKLFVKFDVERYIDKLQDSPDCPDF